MQNVQKGIDGKLLPLPSATFREVLEYSLNCVYRCTCVAHTLQLAVGNGLKATTRAKMKSVNLEIEHASRIVNYVRKKCNQFGNCFKFSRLSTATTKCNFKNDTKGITEQADQICTAGYFLRLRYLF